MENLTEKRSKAMKAELYQVLGNELKHKGFDIEVKLVYKHEKSKKFRKLLNFQKLFLKSLLSDQDQLCTEKLDVNEEIPSIMELKFAKSSKSIIKACKPRKFPVIIYSLGIDAESLRQIELNYEDPPLAIIWWDPSNRPLL